MYSPQMIAVLDEVAMRYAPVVLSSVRRVLSQKKYKATGKSLASVEVSVRHGTQQSAPAIVITLDDSLLIVGMKRLQWTKQPPIDDELLPWAKTIKPDPQEARQLAWATAIDKKQHDTWKAKRWRKDSLGDVLKELNKEVLAEMDHAIETDLQAATKV